MCVCVQKKKKKKKSVRIFNGIFATNNDDREFYTCVCVLPARGNLFIKRIKLITYVGQRNKYNLWKPFVNVPKFLAIESSQ